MKLDSAKAKIVGWLVVGVLVVLAILMSPVARSAPLTQSTAMSVYAMAYGQCPKLTGMKDGCPPDWLRSPPSVVVKTTAELCEKVGQSPACRVRGLYFGGGLAVADALDYDSPIGMSVLLHEYMHHFQWLRDGGAMTSDCTHWIDDEREVYVIQIHFLERLGAATEAMQMRYVLAGLQCPYDLMQRNDELSITDTITQIINDINSVADIIAEEPDVIVHPDGRQEEMCDFKKRAASFVFYLSKGRTEEQFWEENPLPEGWREEVKVVARAIVTAAYAWTGDHEGFVASMSEGCQ